MTGHGGSGLADAVAMGLSGLAVSALVPAVVVAAGNSRLLGRLTPPPGVALALFLTVHAAAVLSMPQTAHAPMARFAAEAAVLLTAVLFWLPAVGSGRRLGEAGRCVYLFFAAPALDVPAVFLIALGHGASGLAMIIGMLPLGVIAMVTTWNWVAGEERRAVACEEAAAP